MNHRFAITIFGMACLAGLIIVDAHAADSLEEAINEGELGIKLRYRFEFVEQNNFAQDAQASALLSRLNYQTGDYHGFNFFIEVDNVTSVIANDFNNGARTGAPERNRFPVVADPSGTEVNQVWVSYAFSEDLGVKLGRQRIVLDNQRFIGGVAWRQNEQTYDGISASAKVAGNGNLYLAYVYNINRIFGDDSPIGNHDTNTYLANFAWPLNDYIKLTAYYYDIDNNSAPAFSTRTGGLRLGGRYPLGEYQLNWGAEWALQGDRSNNPMDYTANYWRLDTGVDFSFINVNLGWEVLEGSTVTPGAAFRTPLATLHLFNGLADQFLTTPDDGISDLFIGLSGKLGIFNWKTVWHDFSAESGNRDFGQELDASISTRLSEHFDVLLQGAFFDADDPAFSDTTKLWLMVTFNY